MKICLILLILTLSVAAEPLTIKKLKPTSKPSLCDIELGMTKNEVKKLLRENKLNYSYGQKFDDDSNAMVPDLNIFELTEVINNKTTIILSVIFDMKTSKVYNIQIILEGYSEAMIKKLAEHLKPKTKTITVEVVGLAISIFRE